MADEIDPALVDLLRKHLDESMPSFLITPDLVLTEAGLDSVTLVALLVDVEVTFDVEFSDDLLVPDTFKTPGSLWEAIAALRTEP